MSFSAVGQVWDAPGFRAHLATVDLSWASAVCIHHTAAPDLSMRPKGWTIQHMRNLAHHYGNNLGWSAGPHLFTDEDEIFGLSPMTAPGVHAASFNRRAIGIEALGNYDVEDPAGARGALVWQMTVQATALLLDRMKRPANGETILFHRDDPKTTKTCPGKKVNKAEFVRQVAEALVRIQGVKDREDEEPQTKLAPVSKIEQARDLIARGTAMIRQAQDLLS